MQPLVVANDFLQVKEEDYELVLAKCGVKDKMVRDSIASVRGWYKMQLHLPEGAISEERIFRFLVATGFSLEKTKQKIDNMLAARHLVPELLTDRDPCAESMNIVRQYMECAVIPQRLDDMTRIYILSFKGDDFSNFNIVDYFKLTLMVYEYIQSTDIYLGEHHIVDWKGVKLGLAAQLTPALIKKFIFIITECYGAKIKSIHYTNVPPYAELAMSIAKKSFSKKIGSRVHVHKDYEGLHNAFPKSILPSDFGGEKKCMEKLTDELLAQLVKRRDCFRQDQYKSDESKRVGVGSTMSKELQGMQGSFRTLDID